MAAFSALAFEGCFLAISIYMMSHPTETLASESFRARYGALYEDLKGSRSALSMGVFHSIRVMVLIFMLVVGASRPVFQSFVYMGSAIVGTCWDVVLVPYEGRLLSIQVYFMNLAKLAASAGYLVLTVPTLDTASGKRLLIYEVIILSAAIWIGLALALIQQALCMIREVRIILQRKKAEQVYSSANVNPSVGADSPTERVAVAKSQAGKEGAGWTGLRKQSTIEPGENVASTMQQSFYSSN